MNLTDTDYPAHPAAASLCRRSCEAWADEDAGSYTASALHLLGQHAVNLEPGISIRRSRCCSTRVDLGAKDAGCVVGSARGVKARLAKVYDMSMTAWSSRR